MTTITLFEDGRPKRDIIELAFEECGSAGYEFERTPEEIASALRQLDALMREWPFSALPYHFADYGSGSPEDLSGLTDINAVALHLALRLAPKMGATLAPETRAAMSRSLTMLQSAAATIPTMPMGRTIAGAGNRGYSRFIEER